MLGAVRVTVRLLSLAGALLAGCGDNTGAGHGGTGAAGSGGLGMGGGPLGGTSGAGGAPGTRVFAGTASMLFDGPSCTGEPGAVDDRWCAFVARGAGGARDLFVVNVSRAAAGVPVTCAGGNGDPNCLLLT